MLGSTKFLLGGVIALGLAISMANVHQAPARHVTGQGLADAPEDDRVSFTARVVDTAMAKDGRPLPTFEVDGVQARAYIADDAAAPVLVLGGRYAVTARVLGPGMLAVVEAGSIKRLTDAVVAHAHRHALVVSGVAVLDAQTQVPAPAIANGDYDGVIAYVNGQPRFVVDGE